MARVPRTINQLSHLERLNLHGIHDPQELLKLPTSLISLSIISSSLESHRIPDLSIKTNLVSLSLYNDSDNWMLSPCNQTDQMKWLVRLTKLEDLKLDLPDLGSPPTELSSLYHLQSLQINCFDLHSLPYLPPTLDKLGLKHVKSLIDWQPLSSLNNLSTLNLYDCWLKEIKVECIEHLHVLCLSDCKYLERLSNQPCLKELQRLDRDNCPYLVDIEGLEELKSLQTLALIYCYSIQRLLDLLRLKNLMELKLWFCESLESIPDLDEEVPCHLDRFDCDYICNFKGPYLERHRSIIYKSSGGRESI